VQAAAQLFALSQGTAIENRIAFAAGGDQAGLGQDLEVVADAGLAGGENLRQFQYAERVVGQGAQDSSGASHHRWPCTGRSRAVDGLKGQIRGAHIHRLGSLVGHFLSSKGNIKKF